MNKRYPYVNNPLGFKLPEVKPVIHPIIEKWEDFTENDKIILQNIKSIIIGLAGQHNIYVYGSRVKGNWDEDSDYDIIIEKKLSYDLILDICKLEYPVKVDIKAFEKVKEFIPNSILIQ
jgi:predicted nucleotidyltransferase